MSETKEQVSRGRGKVNLPNSPRAAGRIVTGGAGELGVFAGRWSPGDPKLHGPNQLCQNEIAKRTGLSQSTVSRILQSRSGQGRLCNIQAIARVCGMTLDQFVREYQNANRG